MHIIPNFDMVSDFNHTLKLLQLRHYLLQKICPSSYRLVWPPCFTFFHSTYHCMSYIKLWLFIWSIDHCTLSSLRMVTTLLIYVFPASSNAYRNDNQKIEVECSWRTNHLSLWTICPFSKHLWRACHVLGIVLGAEDTKISKINVILILKELTIERLRKCIHLN